MGLRPTLMKYLFTACFLLWEMYLRLRGKWRRSRLREWRRMRVRGAGRG